MCPFNIETICNVLEKVLPLNKWEWLILISLKIAYFIKVVLVNLKMQIYLKINVQLYIKINIKVCFIFVLQEQNPPKCLRIKDKKNDNYIGKSLFKEIQKPGNSVFKV